MAVELITDATPELEKAFALLIPQLSKSSTPLDIEGLERILASDSLSLLAFRSETDGAIVGMLSLVMFEIPTGVRAWIEDVVVDEAARGQGAGRALVEAAVELAEKRGAKSIDLTSRPTREAANRLYQRSGFEMRETNIYRFKKA
ncbi:ribosomal protein S18 acetylase RimI-like enzyme [Arcanobacterium wilhelmae]|uniref:Ribosomal protein S18 acetylase RimI-like enzyme n=1 Tax=Arcanobacterium wilhelmae TaxID=1803177 RepID=A0ABT9NDI6_9ACTO|nr:GNAT family N-acetyltransferase [Arcanobacterium wilhelmae]MDP9801436.1 ribosomal protein S18 acetylase RimI-like enzyme [Arcanobacterium wilhelmae]WFN90771.1 GNAT family N-acetyltransferase [Arcanobacterium wilhelmae]